MQRTHRSNLGCFEIREKIIKESEEELLKLAFMVAKKIIRQEIKHDRQILTQLVSEALRDSPTA